MTVVISNPTMKSITSEEFKSLVFDYEKNDRWSYDREENIVLLFSAEKSPYSVEFEYVLDRLALKHETIYFYKSDYENNPEMTTIFGISKFPSTMFIKKGKRANLLVGSVAEEVVDKAICNYFLNGL
ncbi:MAG: thioredoxin family protein [Bacteroidales bacterium]|nr:thioredoxin family protein [Bacteroidales bacterium]